MPGWWSNGGGSPKVGLVQLCVRQLSIYAHTAARNQRTYYPVRLPAVDDDGGAADDGRADDGAVTPRTAPRTACCGLACNRSIDAGHAAKRGLIWNVFTHKGHPFGAESFQQAVAWV
jgi:hypothetical protein